MFDFYEVVNGYKYRLIEKIECDSQLCIAKFEVERYSYKVENIDEIYRYIPELVENLMKNCYKGKYQGFNTNGCLQQIDDNSYQLYWTVKMKQDKFSQLKEYCEDHEIRILEGDFNGKSGLYKVEKQGKIKKKIEEFTAVEGKEVRLKNVKFEFVDYNDQISYEDIMQR